VVVAKTGRLTRREAERARQAEAARLAERRRRQRPYWIVGGLAAMGVVIALVASSSAGSAALPKGTAVFSETNHNHVKGTVHYDRTPPAGGAHNAVWLNCGVYPTPVSNEHAVHSLEHGSVWITYQRTLPPSNVARLVHFVKRHYVGDQRYLVLSPYPGLPAPVVASAWGAQIRLSGPGDPRLAAFVARYAGGGQGGEPGAPCTGGTGRPTG
jgi:hypothetical protein